MSREVRSKCRQKDSAPWEDKFLLGPFWRFELHQVTQGTKGNAAFPRLKFHLILPLLKGDASNLCPEEAGSKYASIKAIFYH